MPLFMGLDCGGTSTRALVVDESGQTLFEGHGGPANLSSTPAAVVLQSLNEATSGSPTVDAVVGGFAGLIGERRQSEAGSLLADLFPAARCRACPDYEVAFAACPPGSDVLVIAGTGSAVVVRDGVGLRRSGAGGPLLGDEGSAFDIAKRAVQLACLDKADVSAEEWRTFETYFGSTNPDEIVATVYAADKPAQHLAAFAPFVVNLATTSAKFRLAVRSALCALSGRVFRATFDGTPTSCHVALTGGVWDIDPVLATWFADSLCSYLRSSDFGENQDLTDPFPHEFRQYHVERVTAPPVSGAVKLASCLYYGH